MTVYDIERWRRRAIVAIVVAVVLVAALVVVLRGEGREEAGAVAPHSDTPTTAVPRPTPTPTPAASSTPTPTPTPSPTPTPTATPTDRPTETVLFEGGPARGPWQQLGTVAEITHPGAPESASYAYRTFWSDPEEENQPDWLWDQLVIEVTDQLVELGEPLDRPAFGGAEGSEPFNSFGGVQDIYPQDEAFTALFAATVSDGDVVQSANYWFLVSFDGQISQRSGPHFHVETPRRTYQDNLDDNVTAMRSWARELGLRPCVHC